MRHRLIACLPSLVCIVFACSCSPSAETSGGGADASGFPALDAAVADGSTMGTSDAGALPPGDHFFDCVATATGSSTIDDASVGESDGGASVASSFRATVLTFDPKYAANHPAGTPGSNSKIQEATASLAIPGGQAISLDGTWSDNGTVSLTGGGWTLQGTIAGGVFTGSLQGSGGTGVLAGADITIGQVGVFFGSQDDGTPFDTVVSQAGPVTGSSAGRPAGSSRGLPRATRSPIRGRQTERPGRDRGW